MNTFQVIACAFLYTCNSHEKILNTMFPRNIFVDKFSSVLEIFIPCTMHFVRNSDRINNLTQLVDQLSQIMCVNFHTSTKIQYENFTINPTEFWMSLNFDFGNLSFPFQKLFPLKYQTKCVAEFLLFTLIQDIKLSSNKTELKLVQKYIAQNM